MHHVFTVSSLPTFELIGSDKMRVFFWFCTFFLLKVITGCEYRIFSSVLEAPTSGVTVDVEYQYKNGLKLEISRGANVIQSIYTSDDLSASINTKSSGNLLTYSGYNREVKMSLEVDSVGYTEFKVSRELQRGEQARDCLMFDKDVQWYGGPEMKNYQFWPIQKQNFTDEAYVTKEKESMAVTERYWLNSHGVYIYIHPETPLFITQRSNEVLCFTAKKEKPYNTESRFFTFEYYIGIADDPREAHMKAIERFLKKPTGVPNADMIKYPIWSTWAKYKRDISETVVREFATKIKTEGFENGQFEIDDNWETCYGSLTINTAKFPDMKALTDWLRAEGFPRVTLWIHPFINVGCEPYYTEAKEQGYFVKNSTGEILTKWWNTIEPDEYASYIDFTNPAAATWFEDRLTALKEAGGFDSFKFDAGETSWAPADPILQGNKALHPSILTTDYINTVRKEKFGKLTEVRSVQNNQEMDIFVRMIDKDTYWGFNNGLASLITTLLQMNMNGYPFVLPDMIGGNGYDSKVTKELFIRWLQANVFMPALQYSYVPW